MKSILIALLFFTALSASAQFRDTKKKSGTDTVSIALSPWQQEQIASLENQKKALDEKLNFLLLTIFDFNHIRQASVLNLTLKPDQLVIIRKKD